MDFYIFIINVKDALTRRETMLDKITFLQSRHQNIAIIDDLSAHICDKRYLGESSVNIYVSFFPATNKQDIESKKIKIHQYSRKKAMFIRGKELNLGEQACFHSHYRLWELCDKLDVPIIVLEDDICFADDFIDGLLDIAQSNIEYVRLVYSFDRKIRHLYSRFYISFDRLSGTQGYFLRPSAARKFLKKAQIWFHCVDDYMDMFFLHGVLNIAYIPHLITDDCSVGSISSVQRTDKNPLKWHNKLTREILRIYLFSIKKPIFIVFHIGKILQLRYKN